VTLAHLLLEPGDDGRSIERLPLLSEHHLEGHVEQQVAQLPGEFGIVPDPDGVCHFVSLFQEVWPQAGRRLSRVPGAVLPQVAD
jgi:hypothetical protein